MRCALHPDIGNWRKDWDRSEGEMVFSMSKFRRKRVFFYSAYKLAFSFGLGVIRGQVGVEDCVLGKGLTASLW
jgi:hypothetical protein